MSEDGLAECFFEILVAVGLAFLIGWCEENPPCGIIVGMGFLGGMMVVVPVYWFIRESRQTKEGCAVVGYFLGFFIWIAAMILDVVGGPSAILGFAAFLGIGIAGLMYLVVKALLEKRAQERKIACERAVVWELKDQLKELKGQLGRGAITQHEYKQRRKNLLERSPIAELKRQLRSGVITRKEYELRKKKLLEKSEE